MNFLFSFKFHFLNESHLLETLKRTDYSFYAFNKKSNIQKHLALLYYLAKSVRKYI